jgi:2-C-methyl-D-erythritol 2,4-cyclodiphosphate synthase
MIKIRSGVGYDIHRLVPGDGLMLGGVKVSDTLRAEAHSDGDVLVHATIDALLGAMAGPDIGDLFPDSDPAFKGISGAALLQRVKEMLDKRGFEIINVDSVVILEAPKLAHFKEAIRANMAGILSIPLEDFSVKAKTREKLDAVGRGEALECYSIAMVRYSGVSDSASENKS